MNHHRERSTLSGIAFTFSMLSALGMVLSGCVTGPPAKEAPKVKGNADGEVMKLYLGYADEIAHKWDIAEARVRADYARAKSDAEAVRPDHLVPFKIAAKLLAIRDLALLDAATARRAEMENIELLMRNYTRSSNGLYEAWEAQGKLTAEMMATVRDGAVELVQIGIEVDSARKREKAARKALEASAEGHEEQPEGQ